MCIRLCCVCKCVWKKEVFNRIQVIWKWSGEKKNKIKIIAPYLICTTTGDTKHLTQNANCIGNRCVFCVLFYFFFATNKNRKLLIKHFWFGFFLLALISLSIFYARFFLFDFFRNVPLHSWFVCMCVFFLHCFLALLAISTRSHQLNFAMSRHFCPYCYRFRNYSKTETNEHSN